MTINFEKMPQTLEKWTELGFDAETLPLVFYAPLVQIAWAEGFLQASERRRILEFARENSLSEDLIYDELLVWLDERPPDNFFTEANKILREILKGMPEEEAEMWREKIQTACMEVAGSSPSIGILRDRDKISREERREFERIANSLGFSNA